MALINNSMFFLDMNERTVLYVIYRGYGFKIAYNSLVVPNEII